MRRESILKKIWGAIKEMVSFHEVPDSREVSKKQVLFLVISEDRMLGTVLINQISRA